MLSRLATSAQADLTLTLEFALLFSSPLPLSTPLLLAASLSKLLLAALSWDDRAMRATTDLGAAGLSVRISQLVSFVVHLAFIAGLLGLEQVVGGATRGVLWLGDV